MLLFIQFETFRRQVKQTACFVSSLSSASDNGEDDSDVLDAIKLIVGERAKLKSKVQVQSLSQILLIVSFCFWVAA